MAQFDVVSKTVDVEENHVDQTGSRDSTIPVISSSFTEPGRRSSAGLVVVPPLTPEPVEELRTPTGIQRLRDLNP
jgi:hypothetical protein